MSPKDPELAHSIQSTLHVDLDILIRGIWERILRRQCRFLFDLTLCLCFNELFQWYSLSGNANTTCSSNSPSRTYGPENLPRSSLAL